MVMKKSEKEKRSYAWLTNRVPSIVADLKTLAKARQKRMWKIEFTKQLVS